MICGVCRHACHSYSTNFHVLNKKRPFYLFHQIYGYVAFLHDHASLNKHTLNLLSTINQKQSQKTKITLDEFVGIILSTPLSNYGLTQAYYALPYPIIGNRVPLLTNCPTVDIALL